VTFAYFDTSALVKRYIRERGSAQVLSLLGRHDLLSSAITLIEVLFALSRKRRDGDLSEENFSAVLSRIESERARWELVEVAEPVLDQAQEIVKGAVSVRTLDAIHIASCLTFEAAAGMRIPFITGDGTQRDAAAQMKLHVVWIG
jgi:predicted nucleic acid-binding protein